MKLDPEDIAAIATEVVRRLDVRAIARELHRVTHEMSEARMDAAYWASLPYEEQKRISRDQRRAQVAAMKAAEEARALSDPVFAEQLVRKQLAETRARAEKRATNKAAKATEQAK